MPRPADSETKYLPGLDGIRAIAAAAVVGYHLGGPWLPGGLLGVGVFFTLSGYLITTILISAWDRSDNLDLRHFWLRRARRLLPALIMVLIVVLVATPVLDSDVLPERARSVGSVVLRRQLDHDRVGRGLPPAVQWPWPA